MKLSELYHYWQDTHDELLEAVGLLSEEQLDDRPHAGAVSIRELILDLVAGERYWITHLVAGNAHEKPRADRYPDAAALVELLTATRQLTARVLEPFSREGLRAVRHVPADPLTNRLETNMPIAWLFWHVMEREIFAWGQIQLRLSDARRKR